VQTEFKAEKYLNIYCALFFPLRSSLLRFLQFIWEGSCTHGIVDKTRAEHCDGLLEESKE